MTQLAGQLVKMQTTLTADHTVHYQFVASDQVATMNPSIGQTIRLSTTGEIRCQHCQRVTKKSFSGGFCYPCSQKLAQCDLCFMQPERCHFHLGTCREPDWAMDVCMQDHIVYLANSSGLKVGITRISQIPTRWMDQGATQALPIFRVKSRYQSGLLEAVFKQFVSDRTDWRKMLKGDADSLDLKQLRDALYEQALPDIEALKSQFGTDAIRFLPDEALIDIRYPVSQYPHKITSLNLDKTPHVEGVLQGIKGQYLILDTGVINIRKYTGYQIQLEV